MRIFGWRIGTCWVLLGAACTSGGGGSALDTSGLGSGPATASAPAGQPSATGTAPSSSQSPGNDPPPPTLPGVGTAGPTQPHPTPSTPTEPANAGTCAEGIAIGSACQPAADTQVCELAARSCTCNAESAVWTCTADPSSANEDPSPANEDPSPTDDMGGQGGQAGGDTPAGGNPDSETWLGVWAGAPQLTETNNNPPMSLSNNTLRQLAYVSFGGSQVRLQISNEFGDGPVTINKVHIAQSTGGSAIAPASDVALTFDGSASVTINQGEAVYSDAATFDLPGLSSVVITIHFGSVPSGITGHPGSRTTSFIATGDAVSNESLSGSTTTDHWYYISRFEVMAPESAGAVVCLGDSITDGRGSTTNENNRWPDALARRLRANPDTPLVSVVNVGIGGNTVLSGGLGPTARQRFDRDVLGTANVRWVLIMEGVNDIGGGGGNADAMTEAYQEFIDKAHAAGVLTYGIPILPVNGSQYQAGDPVRQEINEWIRTSNAFDAVLPLDEAIADPNDPNRIRDGFHDGDFLHLSPQGYQALADAIDLSLFVTE